MTSPRARAGNSPAIKANVSISIVAILEPQKEPILFPRCGLNDLHSDRNLPWMAAFVQSAVSGRPLGLTCFLAEQCIVAIRPFSKASRDAEW